jgi:PAS domain S-box-containing protein
VVAEQRLFQGKNEIPESRKVSRRCSCHGPLLVMPSSFEYEQQDFDAAEILDLTSDTIIVRDLDGTIRFWNRGAQTTYGFPQEDALGRKSHELLATEFPKALKDIEQDVSTTGRWQGELIHLSQDQTRIVADSRWSLKRNSEGKAIAILEISTDITAYKQSEEALRIARENRLEEKLRLIVDAAPNGMILVDRKGEITLVNSQVERVFGYSREELLGQSIEMLVPDAVRAKHPGHRESFDADPKVRSMGAGRDLYGQHKDGRQIPVEIGLNPFTTEGERFVLASIIDITERKRSEERLRLIVEAAPSGMIMVDHSGKIVLVNSQIERLFGYKREELIGELIEMLVPKPSRGKHPTYRDDFFADPKARAMGVGRDLYGLRKDGARIPVEIGLNPLLTEGEKFVLASVVDITERKRAEQLLQEKLIELQRSNEDLQQFAYVCSHDLQEPLRVISNYTQLLAKRYKGSLDSDADEFIDFTVDAAKRMQELINDLLLYSRVDTKGQEFEQVECSDILAMAVANLQVAIRENHALVHCDPLPIVKADSSQLIQLFQNLLSNAIKFRSEKPPEIRISVTDQGKFWQFTVHDNGLGFDMKHHERIFVIFQRLHTKEQYPGSGIGLAICKKIVERHQGRMWVDSLPGQGAEFHFTLPKIENSDRKT